MAALVPVATGILAGLAKNLLGGVFGAPKASGASEAWRGAAGQEKAAVAAAIGQIHSNTTLLGSLEQSAAQAAAQAHAAAQAAAQARLRTMLPLLIGGLGLGWWYMYGRKQ